MMRLSILIIAFLFVFQSTYSQVNNEIEKTNSSDTILDPTFFVLGTLSDYMGRFQYVDREKQVDRYYPFEKPLVKYLTGYIHKELNMVVDTVSEKSNHYKMFSDELSKS